MDNLAQTFIVCEFTFQDKKLRSNSHNIITSNFSIRSNILKFKQLVAFHFKEQTCISSKQRQL